MASVYIKSYSEFGISPPADMTVYNGFDNTVSIRNLYIPIIPKIAQYRGCSAARHFKSVTVNLLINDITKLFSVKHTASAVMYADAAIFWKRNIHCHQFGDAEGETKTFLSFIKIDNC